MVGSVSADSWKGSRPQSGCRGSGCPGLYIPSTPVSLHQTQMVPWIRQSQLHDAPPVGSRERRRVWDAPHDAHGWRKRGGGGEWSDDRGSRSKVCSLSSVIMLPPFLPLALTHENQSFIVSRNYSSTTTTTTTITTTTTTTTTTIALSPPMLIVGVGGCLQQGGRAPC